MDTRTVALGVAAAGAVAAAVVVTISGHGSDTSRQRRDVTAYVQRVNAVQNRMSAPLTRVLAAYRDFTDPKGSPRDPGPELARATATLTTLDRRLARLPAPADAQKLRGLLLALVAKQAAITNEVHLLSTFTPRFARLLTVANRANARLGAALRAVPVPKAHTLKGTKAQVQAAQAAYARDAQRAATGQADAIDAYDRRIETVVRQLKALEPPRVFEPSYHAQIAAFTAVRTSGSKLAAELRRPVRTDVSALTRRFALASRIAQSTAAQKAQIAAIRAYNARAKAIGTAAARVQQELVRLQRDLP